MNQVKKKGEKKYKNKEKRTGMKYTSNERYEDKNECDAKISE